MLSEAMKEHHSLTYNVVSLRIYVTVWLNLTWLNQCVVAGMLTFGLLKETNYVMVQESSRVSQAIHGICVSI
jgi:hypothetical protein